MFAFVFPGQGAQRVGMGRELAAHHAIARDTYAEADVALGERLSKLCFEGPEEELTLTRNSQPAILTASIAALRVLQQEAGLAPTVVAGHSLGEYSALVCAGALKFADAVRLVRQRGEFMQAAVPAGEGEMAAIMGLDPQVVATICREVENGELVSPANLNGGSQIVIAGHSKAVRRAVGLAEQRGALVKPVRVSAPFHCALMKPAAVQLQAALAKVTFSDAQVPVVLNVDAEPHRSAEDFPHMLVEQVTSCVRWEECVKRLAALGVNQVLEIGVGHTLSSTIARIDPTLQTGTFSEPEQLEGLKQRASDGLRPFTRPLGYWSISDSGALISRDLQHVVWSEGLEEAVEPKRWRVNAQRASIRRWGDLHVIWPDGRLEQLSHEEWEARFDGAFVRKDKTRTIWPDGRVEDFELDEWELRPDGTMLRRDGTRVITGDGVEWDFHNPQHHGL